MALETNPTSLASSHHQDTNTDAITTLKSPIENWGFVSSLLPSLKWCPTSLTELEKVEASILAYLKRPFKKYFVNIGPGWNEARNEINTLEMLTDHEIAAKHETSYEISNTTQTQKTPILMVHGFAAGVCVWIMNLDELASTINRKIYAIDVLGFARSSRPKFNLSNDVEGQFVDSIERWRKEQKLDKFIILGHSFGGYISASYALKYPERVSHLILADPWGIQDRQPNSSRAHYRLPIHVRVVNFFFQRFNPLAVLRATGPYGPKLVNTFRGDLKEKFSPKMNEDANIMLDYIYHSNVQNVSGESAFKALTAPYGWAKNPLVRKLLDIDPKINLTFIYGSRSWIDKTPGEFLRESLGASKVGVHIIQGSGHHVYADRYNEFNDIVKEVCSKVQD